MVLFWRRNIIEGNLKQGELHEKDNRIVRCGRAFRVGGAGGEKGRHLG